MVKKTLSHMKKPGNSSTIVGEFLRVRLEVWHYNDLGRSSDLNRDFARLFTPLVLPEWLVVEVKVEEPDNVANRDLFVPAQVEFLHTSYTNGSTMYDVRKLFRHVAPSLVFQLFLRIGRMPLVMKLVPCNVPRDRHGSYSQISIINGLSGDDRSFRRPTDPRVNTNALATLLSNLDDGLSTFSYIVEIFHMYEYLSEQNRVRFISWYKSNTGPASNAGPLDAILHELIQARVVAVNQEAASDASTLVQTYLTGMASMVSCLERIGGDEGLNSSISSLVAAQAAKDKRFLAITPQELYQAVLELHANSLLLARLTERVKPMLDSKRHSYGNQMSSAKKMRSGSGLIAAGGFLALGLGPAGLVIGGAMFLMGAITGCYAHNKVKENADKIEAIDTVINNLDDLSNAFKEIKAAMVVNMIGRIFDIDLGQLGSHEKGIILESFGVDVDALNDNSYREALLESGIDKLVAKYRDLKNNMESFNFEEESSRS